MPDLMLVQKMMNAVHLIRQSRILCDDKSHVIFAQCTDQNIRHLMDQQSIGDQTYVCVRVYVPDQIQIAMQFPV